MSHWNHRVFKEPSGRLGIREATYGRNQEIPMFWDVEPMIYGDSVEDLREQLQWMLKCLESPILIEVANGNGTWRAEVLDKTDQP